MFKGGSDDFPHIVPDYFLKIPLLGFPTHRYQVSHSLPLSHSPLLSSCQCVFGFVVMKEAKEYPKLMEKYIFYLPVYMLRVCVCVRVRVFAGNVIVTHTFTLST